jgi:hypothetical protein
MVTAEAMYMSTSTELVVLFLLLNHCPARRTSGPASRWVGRPRGGPPV